MGKTRKVHRELDVETRKKQHEAADRLKRFLDNSTDQVVAFTWTSDGKEYTRVHLNRQDLLLVLGLEEDFS